jgi:rRNA maturation endonuclease Nob1
MTPSEIKQRSLSQPLEFQATSVFCPHCGKSITNVGVNFCPDCGSQIKN